MENLHLQLLIDKRNQRWFQLLNLLERNSNIPMSTLSRHFTASSRTISSDLKEIKDYFGHSITLVASIKGYSFTIINKLEYTEHKKKLIENEPLLAILSGIFFEEIISIFDWADQLFLAESTLTSYLKKLTPLLEKYHLKITYPLVTLEGEEIDIRNLFYAVFYEDGIIPHYIFPPILINNVISDLSSKGHSDIYLNVPHYKLSYLLFIIYQRVSTGHRMEIDITVVEELKKTDLFKSTSPLSALFEEHTSFSLSSSELVYLILMTLDSISYLTIDLKKNVESPYSQLAYALCKDLNIFVSDQTITAIQSFFQLHYLKNQASVTCLFLPPALLDHNNMHYKEELITLKMFLQKHSSIFLIENTAEFEQTLLIFIRRLAYKRDPKIRNIAFLFEGPTELTLLLEDITRTYIPTNHSVHFIYTYIVLEEELIKRSIDLVVTNFNEYILELPSNMDYLLFSHIPTPDDWNTLIEIIDPRIVANYKISSNTIY